MLLFQKLVDESQLPKPQEYTDTFILTKKLFLVGLRGLQNISKPVERPCTPNVPYLSLRLHKYYCAVVIMYKRNKSPNNHICLQNLSNVFKNGSKRWTATLALDKKVVSDVAVPRVVGWWMGGIAGMCFGAVVLGKFFKHLYFKTTYIFFVFFLRWSYPSHRIRSEYG